MTKKINLFNVMRSTDFCVKSEMNSDNNFIKDTFNAPVFGDEITVRTISVNGSVVGHISTIKNRRSGGNTEYCVMHSFSGHSFKRETTDNLSKAFSILFPYFVIAYNRHEKIKYLASLFMQDEKREGRLLNGDTVYLNDGDFGIVSDSNFTGYEILMNSSNNYHHAYPDGRGVTVFGSVGLAHGLSVNWHLTLSELYGVNE